MKHFLCLILCLQVSHFLIGWNIPYDVLLADHTTRKYSIIDKTGQLLWERPGRGLFEAWPMGDGSVLLADIDKIQKVIPSLKTGAEDKVLWTYKRGQGEKVDTLPKGIIYQCTPLADGNILVTESGIYRMVELNAKGEVFKNIPIPAPAEDHAQSLRLARKTKAGTYLVCYMLEGKIVEVNGAGKVLRTIDVNPFVDEAGPSAYEAVPLARGRILVSLGPSNKVIILNKRGKLEWELSRADLPDDFGELHWITKCIPLENGNIIVINYCKGQGKVKAFEITMDKKIVWQMTDPRVKGLTDLQLLPDGWLE
ncbi:MAG: hypothetical protein AB3N63_19315 [Puniceicoccaceae bacterium]